MGRYFDLSPLSFSKSRILPFNEIESISSDSKRSFSEIALYIAELFFSCFSLKEKIKKLKPINIENLTTIDSSWQINNECRAFPFFCFHFKLPSMYFYNIIAQR